MAIQTCPSVIIQAPVERVWHFLAKLSEWQRWADAKIVKGPDRPLAVGDVVVFRAGPGRLFEVRFKVFDLVQLRRLAFEVELPFGVVNHEVVMISRVSDAACRVTYH
jgi:polyketide cyclase/dehydrase/lipid transport protein